MELHALGGDFAGIIEEMSLDAESRTVEGGADADVGDRAATLVFAFEESSRHIDAARGQKLLLGLEIQGGEREAAAGAGASDDFAREGEGTAEEPRGVSDVASGDFAADHSAGDDFSLVGDGRNNLHGEAVARAESAEQVDVARLLMTEAEVFSYQNSTHVQAANENLLDEVVGGKARQIQREVKDDTRFEAEEAEPVHALPLRGKAQRSGLGAKDLAG